MYRNIYLKHVNYRDVCIHVTALRDFGKFKSRGTFWNMGYAQPYCMGIKTDVEIQYNELSNWLYSFTPNRDGDWRSCEKFKPAS
jgi:hypothetical protein